MRTGTRTRRSTFTLITLFVVHIENVYSESDSKLLQKRVLGIEESSTQGEKSESITQSQSENCPSRFPKYRDTCYEPMIPPAHKDAEIYYHLQVAAKLYFQLKGELLDSEMQYQRDDYCQNIRGCISQRKLKNFLNTKWIPQRKRVSTDAPHDHFMEKGRWFSNTTAPTAVQHHHGLLQDFATYVMSRPRTAVPPPVRQVLESATAFEIRDGNWPGSILPRNAFAPPEWYTGQYNETDLEYDYPNLACRAQCRLDALRDVGLPLSLATRDGSVPDLKPQPGIHMLQRNREEQRASKQKRLHNEVADHISHEFGQATLQLAVSAGTFLMYAIGCTLPLYAANKLVTKMSRLPQKTAVETDEPLPPPPLPPQPDYLPPDPIEVAFSRMVARQEAQPAAARAGLPSPATQRVWERQLSESATRRNSEQKALLAKWAQKGAFGSYCDRLARQAALYPAAKSAVLNAAAHAVLYVNPDLADDAPHV